MFGGIWLLYFQEYDFQVVVKPRRLNLGPHHLPHLNSCEEEEILEENLPNAQLLAVMMVVDYFAEIL